MVHPPAGASWIMAQPTSIVGCIGTVTTIYDVTEMFDLMGVKVA